MKTIILAAAALAVAIAPASAKQAFKYYAPAETSAVGAPHNTIYQDGEFQIELVNRHESHPVSTHDRAEYVTVWGGKGTVVIGGKVNNNKQTGPGEWVGDSQTGGKTYDLVPGVFVVIPAGLPHLILNVPGSTLRYTAFKYRDK